MKVGELCQFTCKPEYAYGSAGSPPMIPPDATLIFEVYFGHFIDSELCVQVWTSRLELLNIFNV